MRTSPPNDQPRRRKRGFERTSGLLTERIRKVGEKRGFAVTRLLTHWAEIVGAEVARVTRPVKVSYGRDGFGGSLTVLVSGAMAPMLEMQKETIRQKVNACYGYNAISRIHLTQTAATGFAEGQAQFETRAAAASRPSAEVLQAAAKLSGVIADDGLRSALEALGQNILSRPKR